MSEYPSESRPMSDTKTALFLLDLGSGPSPRYGHQGVDLYPGPGVTWQCDLEDFPWVLDSPQEAFMLKDSSVDGVTCNHLVEHVQDLVRFMEELWRVCKPGAKVDISHPYAFNVRGWQDPTHVRAITEVTWFYFDKVWRGNRPEFGDTDFELVELDAIPEENWKETAKEFPEEFERAARNQLNVVADLRVQLRCRK
jgi:SAM-dependent methyltransferase